MPVKLETIIIGNVIATGFQHGIGIVEKYRDLPWKSLHKYWPEDIRGQSWMMNTPRCCLDLFSNHFGELDCHDMRPMKGQCGYNFEDTLE